MSHPSKLPLASLIALALSACALNDFSDSVSDTRGAFGDKTVRIPEEEFPEVRANCGLPGAALTRHVSGWRLTLPPETYAARGRKPIAGRIACVENWALERGLNLVVAEAR